MKRIVPLTLSLAFAVAGMAAEPETSSTKAANDSLVGRLIPWLLEEGAALRGIPFRDVIRATTNKGVRQVDRANPADARALLHMTSALNLLVTKMNAPDSPIREVGRINEASSHFEEMLRSLLHQPPAFICGFPETADGKVQRSGYPDLRLVDGASGRVYYLDPKLYARGSRESSFRTFYFEPKVATNKVRDDAAHLLAGFEHDEEKTSARRILGWTLVDLANFEVKLKAEFQGSNRDIYRAEAILATSDKPE